MSDTQYDSTNSTTRARAVEMLDVEDDDGDTRLAREKKRDKRVTVTVSRLGMSRSPY